VYEIDPLPTVKPLEFLNTRIHHGSAGNGFKFPGIENLRFNIMEGGKYLQETSLSAIQHWRLQT